MKTLLGAWMIAVFLAVLAVASGCEDTQVTVGKDAKMYLLANPSTVQIDPNDPTAPLTSTIVATIVNATGVPQKGVLVFFSCTAGSELASSTQPVTTDTNGNAYDTLTIQANAPAETTVTATATSLTQTVKVTKSSPVCSTNAPPTARITPAGNQTFPAGTIDTIHSTSSLSGLTSNDPQNGISSYTWTCFDGASPTREAAVTCDYTYGATLQTYTISLVVTDQGLTGHPECALSSTPATITVTVPAGTPAQ